CPSAGLCRVLEGFGSERIVQFQCFDEVVRELRDRLARLAATPLLEDESDAPVELSPASGRQAAVDRVSDKAVGKPVTATTSDDNPAGNRFIEQVENRRPPDLGDRFEEIEVPVLPGHGCDLQKLSAVIR